MNKTAAPESGQAYAIVKEEGYKGGVKNPYHAAAVIAQDGHNRITLESDAGGGGVASTERSRENAVFDMYSTEPGSGQTFHDRYATKETYGLDAITIVIEKKPTSTVTRVDPGGARTKKRRTG